MAGARKGFNAALGVILVGLFFGPIFGFRNKDLEATATATIYSGDVTSLQVIQGVTVQNSVQPHILPLALDLNLLPAGSADDQRVALKAGESMLSLMAA